MDPNDNLNEQLALARDILGRIENDQDLDPLDVMRLADLVVALDGWLQHKGFLPNRWAR